MARNPEKILKKTLKNNRLLGHIRHVLLVLSFLVTLGVFWSLKLTGITLAGEAFCGKDEHVHADTCPTAVLICELPEEEAHTHSEVCMQQILICTEQELEGHTHGPECEAWDLVCSLPAQEDHVHSEACTGRTLICPLEESQGHFHTEACQTRALVCTQPEQEGHTHGEACGEWYLQCSEEESETHTHGEGCYGWNQLCTLEETQGHTHGDECYGWSQVCPLEEGAGHTHGEDCYLQEEVCGIHVHSRQCYADQVRCLYGLEECQGHTHQSECYQTGTELVCGLEETQGHTHGEECYENFEQCPLEEHIHDDSCYSDITADLETSEDWEQSLANLTFSAVNAENVVMVARSQLGYTESTRNFQVDEVGVRRGITRYGQWYGNPYGDWSAMFVSFCLHYAGVEDMPANAGPEAMLLEWEEEDLYLPVDEAAPKAGNIVFLHLEEEPSEEKVEETVPAGEQEQNLFAAAFAAFAAEETPERVPANAVAIITEVGEDAITVIQGDLENAVTETQYEFDDPALLGYGAIPSRSDLILMATPRAATRFLARPIDYNPSQLTADRSFVIYTEEGGNYYAFDGNGNAVQIYRNDQGQLVSDVDDQNLLLWTFSNSNGAYLIRNVRTGRYMHAYSSGNGGVVTDGAYTGQIESANGGIRFRCNNGDYARLDVGQRKFVVTTNNTEGAVLKLGLAEQPEQPEQTENCHIWLDGTGGGQGQQGGSQDQHYSVPMGSTFQLPETFPSPVKYSQTLRGWYEVTSQTYYPPGAEVIASDNMIFYADWVAATYDIGQFNAQVADTVSTNSFVTTHVFDYNYLFNVLSANVVVGDLTATSHKENWTLVQNGSVNYHNQESLDFVFVDYDGSSRLPDMSGRNDRNNYLGAGIVTSGIYNRELAEILFGTDNALDPQTGEGVIGKTYLGTGDHLFQFMSDPSSENFGYYYYDSALNAASYNQSEQRFYVYEYLEATSDSVNGDTNSDFLPLNSPYANTNGKTVRTYTYNGDNGEYAGVNHYRYDAKYSDNNNGTDYVSTNYAFGFKSDVKFYLPNVPGELDDEGKYGNKDLYGNDLHFWFTGDDDLWVLVDGTLVLDIGGIHGVEGGDINFSTGVVTVNGQVDQGLSAALRSVSAGEHTLSILYLERGSSQSNCALYFNLAPRYSLRLQKEDVLTQELLNGAEFTVFTDAACTQPAALYTSEEAYRAGEAPHNTFVVTNGLANMWGFASGNTYYIKETKAPDSVHYWGATGIIKLTIDKKGIATYDVEVISDGSSGVSPGFTVHGIRIDEETQSAYIVATNAQDWVRDVTTVQVHKRWQDALDHSGDDVTAYLTVQDPDGTVRRIREIILSDENNWKYTWTNLPKFAADGVTPIQYGVDEAYEPGYQSQVQQVENFTIVTETWAEAYTFQNGQTYLIKSSSGCLSTTGSGADTGYKWVNEETAKASDYALWTAHTSGNTVKLTNHAGQTITFYYGGGSPTDFYSSTGGESNNAKQYFSYASVNNGIRLYYDAPNGQDYYMVSSMNSSGKFGYSTNAGNAMTLVPMTKVQSTHTETVTGWGYQITNVPLEQETSLQVSKLWDFRNANAQNVIYQQSQVTVKLLANGLDTGRTVTLNLKNGWTDTFQGLPYRDENHAVISYSVEESWVTEDWIPQYSPIEVHNGTIPTYSTTITNLYRWGGGPELPSTGSAARLMYMLCGGSLMLASLVYGLGTRRKRERRMK